MNDLAKVLSSILSGKDCSAEDLAGFSGSDQKLILEFQSTCRKRSLSLEAICRDKRRGDEELNRIADAMQDIIHIESEAVKLDIENLNMKSIILEAMEELHEMSDAKSIKLVTRLDSQSLRVYGDARRLKKVLVNLLANAVNHTSEGGTIEILAKGLPQEVMVSVVDNGVGIPPERQKIIFNRFKDAEEHPEISHGLCLGLNLVKHIVNIHSGRAWVESEEKRGSIFSFCIPRQMLCNYVKSKKIEPLFA
ncbi:MAG: HAMP domain-containing histidine kinase [Nitrospinota bacterium]|nr:HAMP domain-containing histidine kinase [Nitrospinota bacterium]